MIRLILFLVVSVMAAGGTSMAENSSICSADTVPIQIMYMARERPVITLSAARISDHPVSFKPFVKTVTEHLAAKLAQENLCLTSAESKKRSLVQFVYMPLAIPTANPALTPAQSPGVCRISSPWIDIAVEREPVPSVRAIVRFNERQLLADQAVLAGARNVPSGVAMPLTSEEFGRYASEYQDSELPSPRPQPTLKPIEERVPVDLLWLFRRAQQNTRAPFGGFVGDAMNKAMEKGSDGYTKMTIALIDKCFASDGADIHYNSIIDVADLIQLEEYKIVTPIR